MNRRTVLGALAAMLAACASPERPRPTQVDGAPLASGFYAVVARGDRGALPSSPSATERRISYDPRLADPGTTEAPFEVVLETRDWVPLVPNGAPETTPRPDGRVALSIALARDQVDELARFTRAHLGGTVGIVLEGALYTMHKVRSVIADGRIQITRCNDNACERIFAKLVERDGGR